MFEFLLFILIFIALLFIFFIRTDCVNLDPSLWNGSLKKTGRGSWYSVQMSVPRVVKPENLQKTYLQSSQCLWREIIDYVQLQIAEGEEMLPKSSKRSKKEVKKLPAGKVQRIRIYPNQQSG